MTTVMQTVETAFQLFKDMRLESSFPDFALCQIKVAISCFKLMTWRKFRSPEIPEDDPQVLESVKEIRDVLKNAKNEYDEYAKAKPQNAEKQLNAAEAAQKNTSAVAANLYQRIYTQIEEYSSSSSTMSDMSLWVLRQGRSFDNIVEKTGSIVDRLVTGLFIDRQCLMKKLVNSLESPDELQLLADASRNMDKELHSAVNHRISSAPDSDYRKINIKRGSQNATVGFDCSKKGKVPDGRLPKHKFGETEDEGNNTCIGTRF